MIIKDIDRFYNEINKITDDKTQIENQIRIPNLGEFISVESDFEPDDAMLWDTGEQE